MKLLVVGVCADLAQFKARLRDDYATSAGDDILTVFCLFSLERGFCLLQGGRERRRNARSEFAKKSWFGC